MSTYTVLKARHSLVGRNHLPVIMKLRGVKNKPATWARLKKDHDLEDYSQEELGDNIEGLLGVPASDVLTCAGMEDDIDSARLALHFVILHANLTGQPKGAQLTDVNTAGEGTSTSVTEENAPPAKKAKASSTVTSEVCARFCSLWWHTDLYIYFDLLCSFCILSIY